MGCWNSTCMMSNLPILHGDRCRLIFLQKQNYNQELSYSTDLYQIFSFPIIGYYNSYGGINNIEKNSIVDFFVKQFNELVNAEKIHIHDKDSLKYNTNTIENIIELVSDNRIFICSEFDKNVHYKLTFCMILDNMYLDGVQLNCRYGWLQTHNMGQDFDEAVEVYKQMPNMKSHLCSILSTVNLGISTLGSLFSFESKHVYLHPFLKYCLENNEINLFKSEILKLITFSTVMISLRKIWLPTTFNGYQGDEINAVKLFNEFVNKFIDSRLEKIKNNDF